MAAKHVNLEDVPFGPEDVLDTDEDLRQHLKELEQIISSEPQENESQATQGYESQQTQGYESQQTQGYESQQTQGNESQSQTLSAGLSETLSRQPSFKQNRQNSNEVNSNTRKKRKLQPKIYYILSHGQLALAKHEFKYHCPELVEINHITVPGSILLTHVHRDKSGIKFPLLHHLCEHIESKSNWYDISEDFILGSSEDTNEYDGVYLCIDGVADRVIPFKKPNVKVRLSTVVNIICGYNRKKFTGQNFTGQPLPFKVKVLSCLKKINGNEKDSVCDKRELPHKDCKYLGLSRQCSILIGGKTKRRRRRRKRSRKKSVHAHHRRR